MASSKRNSIRNRAAAEAGLFSGGHSIFWAMAALFIISQFLRVSIAVVSQELTRDLHLTAAQLGLLGSSFFYAFAAMQIPLGWALDRFGPRLMVSLVPMLSVLGLLLFSMAQGFFLAFTGRVLCGIGVSVALMGAFKVFALRYPQHHFGTLTGLMMSVGTLGNMLAATPLVMLTNALGWRYGFALVAVLILVIGMITFRLLRGIDSGERAVSNNSPKSDLSFRQRMALLSGSILFWQIAFLAFFRYGTYVALQGLWMGPFLREVKGFSAITTGNILLCYAIGAVLGPVIGGRMSDRALRSRKWVLVPALGIYTLLFLSLTGIFPVTSIMANSILFFAMAFFVSTGVLVYAHIKESMPDSMSGMATSYVNFFTISGAAVITHVMGIIIGRFPLVNGCHPPEAFHWAFWFCFAGNAASLVFYCFSRDSRPRPKSGTSPIRDGSAHLHGTPKRV